MIEHNLKPTVLSVSTLVDVVKTHGELMGSCLLMSKYSQYQISPVCLKLKKNIEINKIRAVILCDSGMTNVNQL